MLSICSVNLSNISYNSTLYYTGPFDSDFETTSVWTADPSGNFQWTQKAGSTPSSSTGPSGDHTSGTGEKIFLI